ncbi:abl interactor 2-like isoform X2 [Takifugu flavidus]|uniref:abl interactor 2-like isoform X2 n=1 Tax=Takifugu flavidus TaxID=433684 RepID=UPI00254469FF|nr:abl interactor 2-like isoform X2 [Takifugu flavidus]
MKEQKLEEEVVKILDEIPNGRRALLENYDNLLNVAEYCNNNYVQSGDSSMKALNETKNFATQSLASVAYQINTLASSILSLLDAQTNQLHHMESSINLIGQKVEMHKEKVSRREIGVFTAVKQVPRSHKVLPLTPSSTATRPRPPYSRQPINYQQLDGVGHGMKVSGKQSERTGTIRKHGASIRPTKPAEPVQCPVAPPVGSFGKAVAPPPVSTTTALVPPPSNEMSAQNDEDATSTPCPHPPPGSLEFIEAPPPSPPPGSLEFIEAPPPSPPPGSLEFIEAPPPSPPPGSLELIEAPPTPPVIPSLSLNAGCPPPSPPPFLETVVEENSFPSPSPPPPPEEDAFPLLSSGDWDLPTPPPPPNPEVEVVLLPRRSPRRHLPPATRSVSVRVRSGPSSRSRYTRSLFLPLQPYLVIPAPPLAVPLGDRGGFDDILPPLPPPVDYDTTPQSLEKVVALYDFKASRPDDLSMLEGDIIYLIRRHGDGWCEGILGGNRGFFPENHIQSCGKAEAPPSMMLH